MARASEPRQTPLAQRKNLTLAAPLAALTVVRLCVLPHLLFVLCTCGSAEPSTPSPAAGHAGVPGTTAPPLAQPTTSTAGHTGSAAPRPNAGSPAAAPPAAVSPNAEDAGLEPGTGPTTLTTIRNGEFWTTTDGQRIEAHGGGFSHVADTWYWIGEDKSHNAAGFRAVNCYASRDLGRWELQHAIITPQTAPQLAAADRIIERPKVIYNERTKKYVMWLHWEGRNYATAEAGVFTSDQVCGDYTFHASFRPNDNMSRDDTLFQDDDGAAYFVSAARENADLIIYQLSDDYLSIARQLVTLWRDAYREAPALFKDQGRYYLITSGATGWDPNQAKYASATAIAGPWSALANLGDATTFDTQPTYVIPVRGSKTTTYVYAGDRWQDPDLGSSKYVWLPLSIRGTQLTLEDHESWQIDVATGEWSAQDEYLPQSGWKLLSVSSEETAGEDGRAARAFDDSTATFWHSRYSGGVAAYPHELRIDLGAEHALTGMRYVPRQDGNQNGLIAEYALYASSDPDDWGSPVSEGTLEPGGARTRRMFTEKVARYVRFVALRGVGDRPYGSVAELDLVGRPKL